MIIGFLVRWLMVASLAPCDAAPLPPPPPEFESGIPRSGLPKTDGIGFMTMNRDVPSKVIGLDTRRDMYLVTRYTIPDAVEGSLLLIERGRKPIAILEVFVVLGQSMGARTFSVDPSYQLQIGDDARLFRAIEDRPVR